jgi:hypothetical protein
VATRIQAITEFLQAQDLKVDLYDPGMEVQVNVLRGSDRVESKGRSPVWTDGSEEWSAFRIPYQGSGIDAEPHYKDGVLEWSFEKHVEAIGLTGWDWQNRVSRFVGFDFDSISNHARGLSDFDLDALRDRVQEIPWIELRRSKSGRGMHLYVSFRKPVSTQNHTEHAALARSILSTLSGLLDFPFEDKVDTCGGVLWIWHKEASKEKRSFAVVKAATQLLDRVPPNWKDFIEVQRRKRKAPSSIKTNDVRFEDLISRTRQVELDDRHQALLQWFAAQAITWWWDAERSMLVCHTHDLRRAHHELDMEGVFETSAEGKDSPYDHNCFAFPLRNGSWNVFRYSLGTTEHEYWTQSPSGWTTCVLNKLPDLAAACRIYRGIKTKSGEYRFSEAQTAFKALALVGCSTRLPYSWGSRSCVLAPGKAEAEVVVTIPFEEGDESQADWYIEGKQAKTRRWERVVNAQVEARIIEPPDEVVRHVSRPEGKAAWWVLSRGVWKEKTKDDVKSAMKALGFKPQELEQTMGQAVLEDWTETCVPFEEEYPGDRRWNRNAPQLAYTPRFGSHPTWNLILSHVGQSLDVEGNDWCRTHSITSGADYLRLWIASMFRHPFEPLPYLFLHGPQNSGKSIFHEAIYLLLRQGLGYTKADQALTNNSGFNGELYGAILAVVEEVDVSSSKVAYDRIKDWVTGRQIFIRPLHRDGFSVPNSTHWVQCANHAEYCPVFPGDTRIVVGYVDLFEGPEIPKTELMARLMAEGPAFTNTLLRTDIPPSPSRLRLPVLDSDMKLDLMSRNLNPVEDFIEACCELAPGYLISGEMFTTAFTNWLTDPMEKARWDVKAVLNAIPVGPYPKARYGAGGRMHIGNLRVKEQELGKVISARSLIRRNNKLVAKD